MKILMVSALGMILLLVSCDNITSDINQKPVLSEVSGPSGPMASETAEFEWSAEDADGSIDFFRYKKDEGSWKTQTTSSFVWTEMGGGSHTFSVIAVDNEEAESSEISWSFDCVSAEISQKPALNLNPSLSKVSGQSGITLSPNPDFEWIAGDLDGTIDHYACKTDNGAWISQTSTTQSLTDLRAGYHSFSVKAIDDDGAESSEISWNFVYEIPSRKIRFADHTWIVRDKPDLAGPGGNYWSDSEESVWVDEKGFLHMKLRYSNGSWLCSEVYTEEYFGLGEYSFYLDARPDLFDRNIVFGMFIYRDDYHEYDIEFSKWGRENGHSGWYVAHPDPRWEVDQHGFDMSLNGSYTTHSLLWDDSSVRCRSLHGHHTSLPQPSNNFVINEWDYVNGENYFEPQQERVHINLWLVNGRSPADGKSVEVIITDVDLPERV